MLVSSISICTCAACAKQAPTRGSTYSIQQDNRFQNIEHGPSFCSSMIHNVTSPPPAAPNKLPPGHSAHQVLSLTSKLHQTSGTGRTEEATTRTASCKSSLYQYDLMLCRIPHVYIDFGLIVWIYIYIYIYIVALFELHGSIVATAKVHSNGDWLSDSQRHND